MSEKTIPKWLTDKYITNLKKQVEDYFKREGIPVTVNVAYTDESLQIMVVYRTGLIATVPLDTVQAYTEVANDACRVMAHKLKEQLISLLNVACKDQHVIPNYKVKKYYLIFNPEEVDITKLLEVLAVEEL